MHTFEPRNSSSVNLSVGSMVILKEVVIRTFVCYIQEFYLPDRVKWKIGITVNVQK